MKNFQNLFELTQFFKTEKDCINHLKSIIWKDGAYCPNCGGVEVMEFADVKRNRCKDCKKDFSIRKGTIFEDSNISLKKWFMACYIFNAHKKGISSRQLARDIDVHVETAWSMGHRIRKAMKQDSSLLSGIVEMDETYIGGKPRKEAKKKDDNDDDFNNPRGRATKKECVVGMIERGGKVKAKNVEKGSLKSKDLNELVRTNINCDAVLITDEFKGYIAVHKIISHFKINHGEAFVNGAIHTNTIESFWAILKRGIMGQFHKVSKKYLNAYIDEFCWRFNERKNKNAFNLLINKMIA